MSRLRLAVRAAHTAVSDAPRWAVLAAYAIPFCVLPAGLWRIGAIAFRQSAGFGQMLYVICLSVVSELVAFTAVGLVARWGETVPAWIPRLRGRRIPAWAPTLVAASAAVALTALWTAAAVAVVRNRTITGETLADPAAVPMGTHDLHSYVFAACYAPLLLWGPLLGAVTVAYWIRTRGPVTGRRRASGVAGGRADPGSP